MDEALLIEFDPVPYICGLGLTIYSQTRPYLNSNLHLTIKLMTL